VPEDRGVLLPVVLNYSHGERQTHRCTEEGIAAWNAWRKKNFDIRADLTKANLGGKDLREANFSDVNLRGAVLRNANFSGADLRGAAFIEADRRRADLRGADLRGAHFKRARLGGAKLSGADLDSATLVEVDLTGVDLTGCRIYGVSAWGLKLDRAKQQNLVIAPGGEPAITVDDIEVAQFIYLLLNNEKIRGAIDTITSKVVLILGRFTDERKTVLEKLREKLCEEKLLPILFDFTIPASRDVTVTIKLLASVARFVIADVTDATEVRVELHNIVRDFPSLPVKLILLRGQPEFVSLSHLKKYPWVLPIFEYDDPKHLLANLGRSIVSPAEYAAKKLRRPQRIKKIKKIGRKR
jgi:hypothetical protein